MFHIFRWRRERRNENTSLVDLTTDQEHKKSYARRHRLPIYHGRQSLERLFRLRKHRSSSTPNKEQVIRTNVDFIEKKILERKLP